jgi:hypothetical protein
MQAPALTDGVLSRGGPRAGRSKVSTEPEAVHVALAIAPPGTVADWVVVRLQFGCLC